MKLAKYMEGVARWLKRLRLRNYGGELTVDQVAYLHELAEETRRRWKTSALSTPPSTKEGE